MKDARFIDLPPEIRLGMTEQELQDFFDNRPWYKEENDFRIYPEVTKIYLILQGVTLVYPLIYDGTQMVKQMDEYFLDPWNYLDILHISLGYINILFQLYCGTWSIASKTVIMIVLLLQLSKTFFFMRIIMSFSYIVTMIINVIKDLRVFMIFFAILILMFSMIFDIFNRNGASEYIQLNHFVRNLLTTLRLSLGDFGPEFFLIANDPAVYGEEHILFWIVWVIMVLFSALIFLNFIIAEVSSSYEKVKENIDALIYKERAALINEAEDIMSDTAKANNKKFPKYIIIRQME